MSNNDNLILGIIVGAIIAIVLFGKKSQISTIGNTENISNSPSKYISNKDNKNNISNKDNKDNISSQDSNVDIISNNSIREQIDVKLIQLESQLQNTTIRLEQTTNKLNELQEKLKQTQLSAQSPIIVQQPPQPIIIQQQPSQPIIVQPLTLPYQPAYRQEQEQYRPQVIVQPLHKEDSKSTIKQDKSYADYSVYKNNEKWKIKRGQDGRIKSLDIIRDVKQV